VRNDRPVPLAVFERDQMHQLTSSARENLVAARRRKHAAGSAVGSEARDGRQGIRLGVAGCFEFS